MSLPAPAADCVVTIVAKLRCVSGVAEAQLEQVWVHVEGSGPRHTWIYDSAQLAITLISVVSLNLGVSLFPMMSVVRPNSSVSRFHALFHAVLLLSLFPPHGRVTMCKTENGLLH